MNEKRTIIVTGGNGLLGKKLSLFLFHSGFDVLIIDQGDKCSSLPEDIGYIQFDLLNISEFQNLANEVRTRTTNLYGLVNNAAFNPKIEDGKQFGVLEKLGVEEWDTELRLNLTAPVFLTKELLPCFNRSKTQNCKIVNVISTYGLVPPNQSIYQKTGEKRGVKILKPIQYSVSKAGLHMATRYLSTYPGCWGLNINSIAPGGIENGQDKEFQEEYSKLTPQGRMAKLNDLMGAFELLLSEKSDYIQGQVIAVDGGWTTW